MVEYGQTTTVNVNGATVVVGGSKAGVVSNSESKDYRTDEDDQDEVMQFCEKYFTDLELRSDAAADVFGRPPTPGMMTTTRSAPMLRKLTLSTLPM